MSQESGGTARAAVSQAWSQVMKDQSIDPGPGALMIIALALVELTEAVHQLRGEVVDVLASFDDMR